MVYKRLAPGALPRSLRSMGGPADQTPHLLLLAGSGESREIARALADQANLRVTASLLFPLRTFGPLPVPTRLGRFGGEDGLKRFLQADRITGVLDATHPFAGQIGHRAARVCSQLAVPYVRVLRPAWRPEPEDNWIEVPDEAAAATHLHKDQRVFSTTGRATLEQLVVNCEAHFFLRQLEDRKPEGRFRNVQFIVGKGPFSVEEERQILKRLEIDVLVAKNSGGEPSRTKLIAARQLGIPVILIARPPQPDALRLRSVEEAVDWVQRP